MKILIACERSQKVCNAFRVKGHEAYSCDTEDCYGGNPKWHLKMDVKGLLKHYWDMIIAFPPCQYLCSSGMHWTTRGLRDPQLTVDAIKFAQDIWFSDCEKIVMENSIGALSREIRKPDQIIQPWQFGHDASKATCLWEKGVDKLKPTKIIPPKGFVNADSMTVIPCSHRTHSAVKYKGHWFSYPKGEKPMKFIWGNQTPSGQNKLGPSADRARLRGETYSGIADAMAEQWGVK